MTKLIFTSCGDGPARVAVVRPTAEKSGVAIFDHGDATPVEIVRLEYDPSPISEALTECPCCGHAIVIRRFMDGGGTIDPAQPDAPDSDDIPF